MIRLGLILTERCNIACHHCIFGASSNKLNTQDMKLNDIKQYIDRVTNIAAKANEQFMVSFTGGEPFLCFEDLLDGIAYAHQKGTQNITTVTNGFWGADKAIAYKKVSALKVAGLSNLSFSMDDFHQAFIPISSLQQAILACKELDMAVTIKTVVTKKSRRISEILYDLGDLLLGQKVTIEEIPCVPEGRAESKIPLKDLIYCNEHPNEPCAMGSMMVVLPNGDTYPCCGTGWNQHLLLGNMKDLDFDTLYNKMMEQPLLVLLRDKGPHYFISYFEDDKDSFIRDKYISNCDLCQKVLTHNKFEQLLPKVLYEWQVERVTKVLGSR